VRTRTLRSGLVLFALLAACGGAARAAAPLGVPPGARAEGVVDGDQMRVLARLVLHPDDPGTGGARRVGVLLDVAPGWHVYARDPGDVGLPTEIAWSGDVRRVEELPWPEPQRFEELEGELVSRGYENRVLLPALVEPDPGAATPRLRARVELLACLVECIPGSFDLERALVPTEGEIAAGARLRALFAASAVPPPPSPPGTPGVWRALALGLLGGLVLNLMPCVLPVLAIKALSLAELARRGPREALPHAAAYAVGVLGSMAALGLLVVGLRAAGTAVGWGFQFQEPRYVAAVGAVLVLFAANFFGVFEFGAAPVRLASFGASAVGARRSFFDGLLTVALATPCTAPFLGTAAGFAFASPAPVTLAIFLAIGLGLAAPLALVALVPGSARRLPRAGAWMEELRSGLGFLLLGTVVWLLWVLGRSLDASALAAVHLLLLAVAFLAWVHGRLQRRGRAPRPLLAGAVGALVLALGLGALGAPAADPRAPDAWRPEAVEAELRAGRPALVVFTADWCLTCKMNEHLVLDDARVQSELARLDVAVFEADWTRRDERIRAELARFGRSGVPLYLVFSPATPGQPKLLPEVLSVDGVLQALRAAADSDEVRTVTRPPGRRSIGSV
jgi:cytochrome c biogenesis protein CcdA